MRAKLIRIGNSRGIRIPKPVLEQVGLRETVEIRAEKGRLIILPDQPSRRGWAERFAAAAKAGGTSDQLDPISNEFDRSEWTW
jgi:antitoxin MazE